MARAASSGMLIAQPQTSEEIAAHLEANTEGAENVHADVEAFIESLLPDFAVVYDEPIAHKNNRFGLPAAPVSLDISLTGKCNLRCRYCFYADEMVSLSDLPTERWLDFIC